MTPVALKAGPLPSYCLPLRGPRTLGPLHCFAAAQDWAISDERAAQASVVREGSCAQPKSKTVADLHWVALEWVLLDQEWMFDLTISTVQPVLEQRLAVGLFLEGGNLRIDAYAGTGKTTTLSLLARSKPQPALYLAFNRSIATEARQRFPAHVRCSTTHSVAFRGVRKNLDYPEWKLTQALTPNLILEAFRLPETITFHSGVVLEQRSYAPILRDGLKQFLQSSEAAPVALHVPRYGVLERLNPEQFGGFVK